VDLLMWQIRKNCSLFITSGTLSQSIGRFFIRYTSKIDFVGWKLYSAVYDRLPVFLSYLPAFLSKIGKNADLNPLSKKPIPQGFPGEKA